MMQAIEKDFSDIDYYVVATPDTHHVDFVIYSVGGRGKDSSGEYTLPLFSRRGALSSDDLVERIDESEPFAHGSVKWDGVSHWHFDECDRVMIYACSRSRLIRIGEVLARCWDWANELFAGRFLD